MNTLDYRTLEANWHIIIGKLKQKCGEFHHDDLKVERGKEEELLGRLEKRTNMEKGQIRAFIKSLELTVPVRQRRRKMCGAPS